MRLVDILGIQTTFELLQNVHFLFHSIDRATFTRATFIEPKGEYYLIHV